LRDGQSQLSVRGSSRCIAVAKDTMTPPVYALLLVENGSQNRERSPLPIHHSSYFVLTADSAAAGLALCRDQAIDVILLNKNLPDATELEFLAALSAQSRDRPPVLILDDDEVTPAEAIARTVQAIKAGAEDYLLRSSLTSKSLHQAVQNAIEQSRRHSQHQLQNQQQIDTLYESEQRLKAIVDHSSTVIFVKDLAGKFLFVNHEYEQLFNITNDEICGSYDYERFPADVAEMFREHDAQVIAAGKPLTLEEKVPLEDGIHTYVSVKFPLLDTDGNPYALCGIATDISDRIQLQEERDRLLAEAEAANRSKDEFVAVVAHELRSPLNAISGWAKLLQNRKFDEATFAKALDTIVRNTQTQVQLVEDLLDISRMVRGTLQVNFAPVSLSNVINITIENIRLLAETKQLQLESHVNIASKISGDSQRLQQIVMNLLTNAIKFTPPGGRISVELEQWNTQVQLRVKDTGKGIAAEFLPQIFERFQQGQQNSGSKDGLGLGLAIVKKLVELHGGTVTAESAGLGQGSTFTVRFPRLEVSEIEPLPIVIDSHALDGIRILAVDDEPDMLSLIKFLLQDLGAEVQAVTTAAAALGCVSQFRPDILISDLAMPEGNGYELVQQIKDYPGGQVPAIALTAYASATYEERSLQAGFQRHLTKPVEAENLAAAIIHLVKVGR
jgi:PAS domain S-box-containing protein